MIANTRIFRNERGQAMVEAGLTMLLLFVFIFAIWEGGRALQVRQVLTDAAREGARYAVAPLTQTLPGTMPTQNEIQTFVQAYLEAASVHVNAQCPPSPSGICVDTTPISTNASTGVTTSFTMVTVTYPYHIMTLSMFGSFNNMILTGYSKMRSETSQ